MDMKEQMVSRNQEKYHTGNILKTKLINSFVNEINRIVLDLPHKTICELGCGEGFILDSLSINLPDSKLEGYDIFEPSLEVARGKVPTAKFGYCDILEASKYISDSYDVILTLEVLEHIEDYRKALDEISGLDYIHYVISVPNEPYFSLGNLFTGNHIGRMGKDPEHINFWNESSLNMLLKEYFKVITIKKSFPWLIAVCEPK